MAEHSKRFPPSASKRWLTCTASALLPTKYSPPSIYAAEGIAAHSLFETFLMGKMNGDVWAHSVKSAYIAHETSIEGAAASMVKPLQESYEYLLGLELEGFVPETKVNIPATDSFGTCDVIGWKGSTLHIADLKYGKGVLEQAAGNTQLMLYALGALEMIDMFANEVIDTVAMHILQPRRNHFDECRMPRSELQQFDERVRETVSDIEHHKVEYTASEEGCRWCDAKPTCAAFREYAMDVPFEEKEKVPTADSANLALVLDKVKILEALIKAVKIESLTRLRRGDPIPGYKLVGKLGDRKWGEDIEEHMKTLGLVVPNFETRKLLSPAQMEKSHPDAFALLEEQIKREKKPTVVPVDDTRQTWDDRPTPEELD